MKTNAGQPLSFAWVGGTLLAMLVILLLDLQLRGGPVSWHISLVYHFVETDYRIWILKLGTSFEVFYGLTKILMYLYL
jgi:hypothetical protein